MGCSLNIDNFNPSISNVLTRNFKDADFRQKTKCVLFC